MTGLYSPTSGEAFVSGNSIKESIAKVQQLIGYCPQFDVLWSELTVEEHLYFYTKLKNVDNHRVKEIVDKTLENTKLTKFRNFLVCELSGGMKRRLSLGISLVGDPKIVFLDEPTTGLDPENKRQIWEILSQCKQNKCMILTTHLMEEAEILADRIGIIVNGKLKCLGTKFKLKREYGRGFKLTINFKSENLHHEEDYMICSENIDNFIKLVFENSEKRESYKTTLVYFISNEEFDAEKLFNEINDKKEYLKISNWAISQVSLEDIFIKLTEDDIYT